MPLGVIGLITPWNYPMNLAMRAVAPGLAFGNTVVLKPAELTPIIGGQVLAEAADGGRLPPGVFNVVTGDGRTPGDRSSEHPGLDLMDFTGSREVGLQIAARGQELPRRPRSNSAASNAFVVLDDADVELAASCAMVASLRVPGPDLHQRQPAHRAARGRRRLPGSRRRAGRQAPGRRPDRPGDATSAR